MTVVEFLGKVAKKEVVLIVFLGEKSELGILDVQEIPKIGPDECVIRHAIFLGMQFTKDFLPDKDTNIPIMHKILHVWEGENGNSFFGKLHFLTFSFIF